VETAMKNSGVHNEAKERINSGNDIYYLPKIGFLRI
jgi:hypothetical protein